MLAKHLSCLDTATALSAPHISAYARPLRSAPILLQPNSESAGECQVRRDPLGSERVSASPRPGSSSVRILGRQQGSSRQRFTARYQSGNNIR